MGDSMCDKDEVCKGCYYEERSYSVGPCKECSRAFSGMQKDWYLTNDNKPEQPVSDSRIGNEEYLTKLIEDHWAYIEKVLEHAGGVNMSGKHIKEIGFHYKSAFRHGFKHALEYVGQVS